MHLKRGGLLLVMAFGLLTAACGTRLPDEAFVESTSRVAADGGGDDASTTTTIASADGGGDGSDTDTTDDSVEGSSAGGSSVAAESGDGGAADAAGGSPDGGGPNQASDAGVTEGTIRLGNITAENGALGDTFAPAVRGLRAWVQHTNANGGIRGRKIELFTCDDREDRSRSLECARRLVEQDEVFALVATNSRALGGAAQYLADNDVPVMGFPITNSFYRYPEFFTIYGVSYPRDGQTVGHDGKIMSLSGQFRWFKQNLKVSKAAVFAYDIDESKQQADAMVKGLELEGFSVTLHVVSFAAPSFDQAVAEMQNDGTELVYDTMDPGANRRLCDAMARRRFKPKAKVSTVVIMGESVGQNYNDTCRDVIYTSNESRPYTSDEPEIVEFRQAYARYQPGLPLHQWAMEAWAMGNITEDAVESMGPAPTRQGFIEYLNTMEPNTADGIMVGTGFSPSYHDYTAATARDCFSISRWQDSAGGFVAASSPFPFCYPNAKQYGTQALEQGN